LPIRISPDGIEFDEDSFVDLLIKSEENRKRTKKQFPDIMKNSIPLYDSKVDNIYAIADFLTRFFIVLNSPNITSNIHHACAEQKRNNNSKVNNKRIKKGKIPITNVSPIIIDLSMHNKKSLESDAIKVKRELLGWTKVRRSKPIISKYGKIYTRKPHDRRIAAPVDRRNVTRVVTAKPKDFSL